MPEQQTATKQVTQVTTQSSGVQPVVTSGEHPQKVYEKKKTLFRVYQITWYVLGVIETLLIFRLLLKALGASPGSGFASLIYILSDPLALPFRGIFQSGYTETGGAFEWSTIIASIVYLVLAYGLVQLFQLSKPTTPQEVEQKVNSV